jgi:uncharacterized protein (DUF2147 family)
VARGWQSLRDMLEGQRLERTQEDASMTGLKCAVLSVVTIWALAGAAHADPVWLWRDKDGTTIRVSHCGAALCGTIVSLKTRLDPETGKPWTDKHNEDAARQGRPLAGVQVFISMKPSGAGKWSGRLYDSDSGKTLDGHLVEAAPGSLRVEGCVGSLCGGEDLSPAGRTR